MEIFREKDLEKNVIKGATVAVLGYGNQGHAHALNLRDSGVDVIVGARRGGSGWSRAEADGFEPREIGEATAAADFVANLLPDEVQADVYASDIAPNLRDGAALFFAHGFTIAFGAIAAPAGHDVILVAPKGQGHYLRRQYKQPGGLPCLVAVERDVSGTGLQKALSYAQLLGCLQAGAIRTTFRSEAVTDLFGEQVVLCGGVPALVKAAFDTLVARGYEPEVAYLECLHELKIITDLMYSGGVSHMRRRISHTAAWGSFEAEKEIDTHALRRSLTEILDRIESGEFAAGWLGEAETGQKRLSEEIENESKHPIEKAGRDVRALMPDLEEDNS